MRNGVRLAAILTMALAPLASGAAAAGDAGGFDGDWTTTVSCPAASGAMGFAFDVPTTVKEGVLHGERLKAGEPGRFVLDGRIAADGHADLYATGLVGAPQFAVGQRPRGTDYAYHVTARFEGAAGSGARVEGRRCDLAFVRR